MVCGGNNEEDIRQNNKIERGGEKEGGGRKIRDNYRAGGDCG